MRLQSGHVLQDLQESLSLLDLSASDAPAEYSGVATDTRVDLAGCLFVALRGEHFDAHRFVTQAVSNGATGCLIDRLSTEQDADLLALGVPTYVVGDTVKALHDLARGSLQRSGLKIVAITGSNGKTTTKDLTASALGSLGTVHATYDNRNNHIGVPLTVLERRGDEEFLVAEIGANHFGEIETLSKILQPHLVAITNIGRAHLENFGSIEGVLQAKSEIFVGLREGGVAVLNADDPHLDPLRHAAGSARVVTYGFDKSADVRIENIESDDTGSQHLTIQGHRFHLQRPGRANASNAAAAFCVALECGAQPKDIIASLSKTQYTGQRSCWVSVGSVEILDDTYNANPDSMQAALQLIGLRSGRKIAVLGSMFELGEQSKSLHEALGRDVHAAGITRFYGFGASMQAATEASRRAGLTEAFHFDEMEELIAYLKRETQSGDVLLVKGSRGCRMERVVEALRIGVA